MRPIRLAGPALFVALLGALLAPLAAPPLAPSVALAQETQRPEQAVLGTWIYKADPVGFTLVLEEGGKGKLDDEPIAWRLEGGQLVIVEEGETIRYGLRVAEGKMTLSGGDLDAPITLAKKPRAGLGKRVGGGAAGPTPAPAPAPAPGPGGGTPAPAPGPGTSAGPAPGRPANPLVGVWVGPDDGFELRADGVIVFQSAGSLPTQGRWESKEGAVEVIGQDGARTRFPVRLEGDVLLVTDPVSGEVGRYARRGAAGTGGGAAPAPAGANAALAAAAGVWVGEESHLDPSLYMRLTQYLVLYPDGSVSWAKSEGGASRTQVSECIERFRSWREGATGGDRIVGRWQTDGSSIVVQFSIWNNLRSEGPIDLTQGKMRLSGMGALNEGQPLVFEKQR